MKNHVDVIGLEAVIPSSSRRPEVERRQIQRRDDEALEGQATTSFRKRTERRLHRHSPGRRQQAKQIAKGSLLEVEGALLQLWEKVMVSASMCREIVEAEDRLLGVPASGDDVSEETNPMRRSTNST